MKEALGIRLKKRAQKLKQDIPVIYRVWKDQDTPLAARLVVGCTLSLIHICTMAYRAGEYHAYI